MHGKLVFGLCRVCAEIASQTVGICELSDEERAFTGTWVSLEISEALILGYKIRQIFEIWQYEVSQYVPGTRDQNGLFRGYIDEFFKQKTHASGYPADCDCDTLEERNMYIDSIERAEGIELERERIAANPALQGVAKLSLNSLWGKFGQREDRPTTRVITTPESLHDLLMNPDFEVTSVLPASQDVLYVGTNLCKSARTPLPTTNVVIAAYMTCQARLKLYGCMKPLGKRLLYVDTDSLIYLSKINSGQWKPSIGP